MAAGCAAFTGSLRVDLYFKIIVNAAALILPAAYFRSRRKVLFARFSS